MAKIIMTAQECAQKHLDAATKFKTVYAYAMYGWKITDATIDAKARQDLNHWYSKNNGANTAKLRKLVGKGYWGFDCVNLTKGILWGWVGDDSKTYGGAVYGANGVPDTNANGMIKQCYDVSTDFSEIIPGEGLWMDGHWGMYVGNGLAVECTNWRYHDGVQVTAVLNIGKKSGYNGRKWTKHGKLPWIKYSNSEIYLCNGTTGDAVKDMQNKLIELGYNLGRWGADGDFGAATENAVMAFQDDNGLPITGIVDDATMKAIDDAVAKKLSTKPVDKPTAPANPMETYSVVIGGLSQADANKLKSTYPQAHVVPEM